MSTIPETPEAGGRAKDEAGHIGFGARFVSAVSIGSLLNPINSSIIAIALVAIGNTFAVGSSSTAWLVSSLYLATAIGQPTMGRLADRLGPRRIYLSGSALVMLGGLLGYAAPSLGMLVVSRVVIGLGTSAAYPAAMALIRRRAARMGGQTPAGVLGALAITGQVTMAIGPTLGGLLIMLGGWRFTFLVNVPLGLASVLLTLLWLPKDDPVDRDDSLWRAIDASGVALFAAALTGLLVFLMDLAHPRWWLLALVVAAFAALTRWELRVAAPFLDVRMLANNRALTMTYLRYGTTMLGTYCFIYGWAMWLERGAGKTASMAGLLMTPSFVVATVVSFFAARARRTWGPLVTGAAVLSLGSATLLLVGADTPIWQLVVVGVLFGLQNGLNATVNQTAMYTQAPAEQTGVAAGLMRSFMYVGAIASASMISLAFGGTTTDHGLHALGAILTAGSAVLLVATLLDRSLRTGRMSSGPAGDGHWPRGSDRTAGAGG